MKNKINSLLTIYFLVGLTNLLHAQCTAIPTTNVACTTPTDNGFPKCNVWSNYNTETPIEAE